jgi:hypothetical protein
MRRMSRLRKMLKVSCLRGTGEYMANCPLRTRSAEVGLALGMCKRTVQHGST